MCFGLGLFCVFGALIISSNPSVNFVCMPMGRHNSTLRILSVEEDQGGLNIPLSKSVALELVLCQLRNAHVTEIDASHKHFDDADATRIAEALRCDHAARVCVSDCLEFHSATHTIACGSMV